DRRSRPATLTRRSRSPRGTGGRAMRTQVRSLGDRVVDALFLLDRALLHRCLDAPRALERVARRDRSRLLDLGCAARGRTARLVLIVEQAIGLERAPRRQADDDEREQDHDQSEPASLTMARCHGAIPARMTMAEVYRRPSVSREEPPA